MTHTAKPFSTEGQATNQKLNKLLRIENMKKSQMKRISFIRKLIRFLK